VESISLGFNWGAQQKKREVTQTIGPVRTSSTTFASLHVESKLSSSVKQTKTLFGKKSITNK
jgi:hypothetical protein